jgi:hypothetical protein
MEPKPLSCNLLARAHCARFSAVMLVGVTCALILCLTAVAQPNNSPEHGIDSIAVPDLQEPPGPGPKLRLLIPAYFYPAGEGLKEWDRLLTSKVLPHSIIIVNPASGPGKSADPNYIGVLDRARKTKATLIGYVTTSYGKRPLAEVKAEVDSWMRLYPAIRGIFFDEQASGPELLDYYEDLYDYARKERGLSTVVSNPGTICDERYLSRPCADTTCLFEGVWKPEALSLPRWTAKRPGGSKAALSYGVTDAKQMAGILRAAASKQVGVVYVTDATGVNPWRRLPVFWEEEAAAIFEMNKPK